MDFFCMRRRWVWQKMRLEKKNVYVAEDKIVFLLHSTNTNPNPFIKQGERLSSSYFG
jgi:hypothetical protein